MDIPQTEPDNGPTPSGAQLPGQAVTSQAERVLTLILGLAIFALIIINNTVESAKIKRGVYIALPILGMLALAGILAYTYRKNPAVARTTAVLLMVLFVMVCAILPVLLLAEPHRVLLLKLAAIATLSLIPGLLYIQFIRVRGQTVRAEFVQNLQRLRIDIPERLPSMQPGPADENNLYIAKFESLYGRLVKEEEGGQVRVKGETLLPVLLATILLSVGWAFALQPETVIGLHLFPERVVLSGRPALPTDALRFAFAGSYFFILQMLIRRYFQDDLKTTAYINSTARIIVVALTVTTIGSAWPASWTAEQLNVLAFFIGVFPNVGLKALQTLLTVPLRPLIPSLERDYPLSDLDGLNVWYESRLLEEGIEDMQNLATANVVDVMLRTKVPVGRLVDWVDQAHLFLRVKGDGKEEPSDREKLRLLGIRCATDLEDAFTASPDASGEDLQVERERISRLRWVLNKGGIDDGAPSRTSVMLKTFEREPNLEYVRNWKTVSRPAAAGALPMTIRVEDLLPEDPEALDRVGAVAAAVEAAPRMEEPAPAPAPAS